MSRESRKARNTLRAHREDVVRSCPVTQDCATDLGRKRMICHARQFAISLRSVSGKADWPEEEPHLLVVSTLLGAARTNRQGPSKSRSSCCRHFLTSDHFDP